MDITVVPLRGLAGPAVDELVRVQNLARAESQPDDPPMTAGYLAATLANIPAFIDFLSVQARDDAGTLVGMAGLQLGRTGENEHLAQLNLFVVPAARRQGIGTRLLAAALDVAADDGRRTVISDTIDRVPAGAAFATHLGATPGLEAHVNRLAIADVDTATLKEWVAAAATRSAGYEMLAFDGPTPDDLLEAFVDLIDVMNTAPRDDLDVDDEHLTAEHWRAQEALWQAQGTEHWTLVARERASGALAGFHDVRWNPQQPATVWVGMTGVRREHRGHALGKWLKAAMTLRIVDERPSVTDIRTGNADSNDAMLGINRAMGYRPYISTTVWQAAIDDLRAAIGSTA